MSHTDFQDLLAAYAVNAIDPADGRALDQHLETCAECRAELDALRDASGLLAHAATPAAPGNHVRAEILAKIRSESGRPKANVVTLPQRSVWPNLLKLAAAIAFIALLVGAGVLWRRDVRLQQELAQQRQLIAEQQELVKLLSSASAKRIDLAGTQSAGAARATLLFEPQTGRALLLTAGLPTTPADKAYEVWFIPKGGKPIPGKVFTVDPSGHAMISEQVPPAGLENAVIAITIEPGTGSASPTGAIYLASPAS
jgi:anti-sigma-K factor RskA